MQATGRDARGRKQYRYHAAWRQVRDEVKSDVPLKEKGWQEALEALAFDLKINRLRVRDGDLTYMDRGPFKPLRLSRLRLNVENIRNIREFGRVTGLLVENWET